MTRNLLRWLARGLIGSLLSMQLALAAHACSVGLSSATAPANELAADPAIGMAVALTTDPVQIDQPMKPALADCNLQPGVGSSDEASMNLCNEHCKRGQQSDQAGTLVVPMACLTARYVIAPPLDITPLRRPAAETESALAAGRPPHAILHCVLRT